ncbi:Chromate resistance protein ChrB [Streptomyces sp. NPDC001508]|uniref:Chromate resistance protein ChrB n=1 Tax=Streptomyces sp. NPDC001508 TaxID=3154656 RepID=UPI0033330AF9
MNEAPEWLVLIYRVPPEPSRLRAAVWRRLKGLGALYLQNSVAALPTSPAAERALRSLRKDILDMGGTASLLSSRVIAGASDVVAAFNATRDDEYEEIIDKCDDFRAQVKKEYEANHFTYAELEENEEDLHKLQKWFAKVVDRDVLGAAQRNAAEEELKSCVQVLEDYANRVFREEDKD